MSMSMSCPWNFVHLGSMVCNYNLRLRWLMLCSSVVTLFGLRCPRLLFQGFLISLFSSECDVCGPQVNLLQQLSEGLNVSDCISQPGWQR